MAAICDKEREQGDYKRFEKLRRENEKQKANLVDALKHGKAVETLLDEIAKLEVAHSDIERQIIIEKAKHLDLSATEISFFLSSLRNGDINDIQYRRLLVTVMVNAVYLYDDLYTVIFNSSDKPVEVTESLVDMIESEIINCEEIKGFKYKGRDIYGDIDIVLVRESLNGSIKN